MNTWHLRYEEKWKIIKISCTIVHTHTRISGRGFISEMVCNRSMFIHTQCDLKSYVCALWLYVEIKLCLLPKVKEKSTVEGLSRAEIRRRKSLMNSGIQTGLKYEIESMNYDEYDLCLPSVLQTRTRSLKTRKSLSSQTDEPNRWWKLKHQCCQRRV